MENNSNKTAKGTSVAHDGFNDKLTVLIISDAQNSIFKMVFYFKNTK